MLPCADIVLLIKFLTSQELYVLLDRNKKTQVLISHVYKFRWL